MRDHQHALGVGVHRHLEAEHQGFTLAQGGRIRQIPGNHTVGHHTTHTGRVGHIRGTGRHLVGHTAHEILDREHTGAGIFQCDGVGELITRCHGFGVDGGWKGLRTRREFVNKFTDVTGASDNRAMFHTTGQTLDIASVADETQGYAVTKWTNKRSDGSNGSSPSLAFVDTDFPMFRLGDAYLMYAELAVRGQGSLTQAVTYVNALRTRANASSVSVGDLNLDFVLAERSRELYWECHRRQDLIRFGKFTGGSYVWQWKGNSMNGAPTADYLKLFPIPDRAKAANPTLVQNTGY